MVSTFEHAIIASHVYDTSRSHIHGLIFGHADMNSLANYAGLDGWYRVDNVPFSVPASLHYYAALYIKFEHGEAQHAVIAFRGTVMKAANLVFGRNG